MVEFPAFESPVTKTYVLGTGGPVDDGRTDAPLVISDISATAKTILRAGPDTEACRQIAVPFGASRTEGGALVVGQRPEEWVLLGPAAANRAVVNNLDRSGHVSVIDCTHSRALFRLTGADAASVLEKLCSLDWDDQITPDGAAASASVARVTCDIVRNDQGGARSYLISCDRSFGQYLFDVLLDAGREFGISSPVHPSR